MYFVPCSLSAQLRSWPMQEVLKCRLRVNGWQRLCNEAHGGGAPREQKSSFSSLLFQDYLTGPGALGAPNSFLEVPKGHVSLGHLHLGHRALAVVRGYQWVSTMEQLFGLLCVTRL